MGDVSIHPLEKLRRERGLTQRDVADKIYASDGSVRRAEQGLSIGRKLIDRLLQWSDGQLKREDFIEANKKGGRNGKERKIGKRGRAPHGPRTEGGKQRPKRRRSARVPVRSA